MGYLTDELTNVRHKQRKSDHDIAELVAEVEKRDKAIMDKENEITKLRGENSFMGEVSRAEKIKVGNLIEQLNLNKIQLPKLANAIADLELRLVNKEKEISVLNSRNQEVVDERDQLRS